MDDESVSRNFYIGLDLGEMRDYAALAVLERIKVRGHDPTLELRTLKRWPHGTKYPAIVSDVSRALMSTLFQVDYAYSTGRVSREFAPRTLIIDRGGVGLPVVELFENALPEDVDMLAVFCHAGKTVTEPQRGYANIPKRDLIYAAVTAFQTRVLQIARGLEHGDALKNELSNFRRHISDAGRDTYEAGKGNDDLVFALSLCCWAANRPDGDWEASPELLASFSYR